jgi:hypothetical protein
MRLVAKLWPIEGASFRTPMKRDAISDPRRAAVDRPKPQRESQGYAK